MAAPTETLVSLFGADPLVEGLVGSLVIALLNPLGAAAIISVRDSSERPLDVVLA